MKTLTQFMMQLTAVQKLTKQPEIGVNQVLTLLHVAAQPDIPQANLEKLSGVSQSAVSRTVAKLGQGITPREPGLGLLETYEDPFYRKRKLVRLTARGADVVKALEAAVNRRGAH